MRSQTTSAIFSVILLAFGATASRAASPTSSKTPHGAWTIVGPGGGGAMFIPTVSPHDPNVVLVGCDMTGSYLSKDGGKSWRMINLRGVPRLFVFDPSDPNTMYAKTIGLWRSTDQGDTWALVHPAPASVARVLNANDHADEFLATAGGQPETIVTLAVDPSDSKTLYAVFFNGQALSLRVSPDWGKSWTQLRDLPGGARAIYIDPKSAAKDRTLYVIGDNSVLVREAGAWRTGAPAPGVDGFASVSAGFAPKASKPTIYGISQTLLVVSSDGGNSWHPSTPAPHMRAVGTSLNHPEVAYLSYSGLKMDGEVMFGVAKTTDAGKTWDFVWKEGHKKAANVDEGWISERYGPDWGEHPLAMGVSPTKPDMCYATDMGRTLRTVDGGKNWLAAYTRKTEDGGYTSRGLDVTNAYGIHFDPLNPKNVYITHTDISLLRSENGGKSWASATMSGVPRRWHTGTYWVEFDPEVKGRMWAVMGGTHDIPRPKMWRRTSPSTFVGGVCLSEDGGRTCKPLTQGMPPTSATHILVDPTSRADARVLYVAGFGRGVFKSTDGGASWTLKNKGLPEKEPFAWRMVRDSKGAIYLILARRSEDASFGTERDGALYRSTDGAESWVKLPLPNGVNGPNGLAIDPQDPNRLYLAAWGRSANGQVSDGGIFLSTDRGATWRSVHSKDQHVFDVTTDPRNPALVYACGFENSAWRSTDKGETWQRIRGYNFKWGQRIFPDPADPSMIYIATFGGGVWHGPAAGDPNATEDIATPELALK